MSKSKKVRSSIISSSIVLGAMGILISILLLFLCTSSFEFESDTSTANIQFISVIFRHGDRTPTETYPNDPYKDYPWPDGWGALTKMGKNQLYVAGQRLRTGYRHLIKDNYSPADVYVQSSDSDRCHMSAAVFLAGLYPPKGNQLWHDDIFWQPIPIHSYPKPLDQTLAMGKLCTKYNKELNEAYQSKEIQEINKKNADVFEHINKHAGKNFTTITDIEFFHTTLEIEEKYGLKLPNWTAVVYPNRTLPLMKQSLAIFSYTPFMKRIRGGSFIKEVINNMILKRDGKLTPNRDLFLYSAHDITLVHVFRTLGFEDLFKPEYGATLIFELSNIINNTDSEVNLKFFNTTEQMKPTFLKIPKCGEPCFLNNFVKLMTPSVPAEFDEECENNK
ncbi:lysosomal acid phosphatase-like [Chrysoperla carnea]|uniref:lysosomal acid phosphatase-like n=1 Tax=Chrysoperla carnea TaxID=189513 RepID=UPI001D096F05|nr:lysosomal acid phosphatase-like [Chrysoperla carnea]